MAAVDSHKHPGGTFWKLNIITKGSELLMLRPGFLCGCTDPLSIMSRKIRPTVISRISVTEVFPLQF